MEKQPVELVMWETVRSDCKYPKEDDNNDYIYGLNLIGDEEEMNIVDVEWLKSEEERADSIEEYNLRIINEV